MNELRRRSVAADIRTQSGMPPPYELHIGGLIAAVIAVVATAILIWLGT
jgi:hypothetical protein